MGMRATRVTVGLWVLVFDGLSWALRNPTDAMDKVERRGLKVEKELNRRLTALERRSETVVQRVRGGTADGVRRLHLDEQGAGDAEEEIERQVEKALLRLGLPSRERLEQLTREIESLSHKIDQELALLEQV
jgi:hypothetical protein